ncbi:signal peptidase II [Pelagibacterales bacterium SAG-MED45]|nr:signal peptidase II [Pelagibacterales bacterium SAG-MED45]
MNLKNYNKNIYIDFIVILLIFLLDRISKLYIIYLDEKLGNSEIYFSKFFNIQLIWNDGIAFGLLAFNENIYYNALTGIIVLVTLVVFFFMIRTKGIEKYCFMMILGGSLGNIFDRLYYSAVPDFIDLHYQNFHWFIFNVADIFITLGVLLLIFLELFLKKNIL